MNPFHKILFLYRQGGYASSGETYYDKPFGLINAMTSMRDYLISLNCEVDAQIVVSDEDAADLIESYAPTLVVLEALWASPQLVEALLAQFPQVQFVIRVHSNFAFLAHDIYSFDWLSQYADLQRQYGSKILISGNNEFFCEYLAQVLEGFIVYLPNYYTYSRFQDAKEFNTLSTELHIGCFGALRQLKNHLAQALAAISLAQDLNKRLFFHINVNEVDRTENTILNNLRALFASNADYVLVEHDYISHEEFLDVIGSVDLNYQVSFSETFNLTSADSIVMGIPVITSSAIEWSPTLYQANPQDVNSIKNLSKSLLNSVATYKQALLQQRDYLIQYNQDAIQEWLTFLRIELEQGTPKKSKRKQKYIRSPF